MRLTPHLPIRNLRNTPWQAKTGGNYATREEWMALQGHVQEGFAQDRIMGVWDKVEFRLVSLKMAESAIKPAAGDTYVIIASCPNQVGP
jgi:hypothetical protein